MKDNKKFIQDKITLAEKIVDELHDLKVEYKPLAFSTTLYYLLKYTEGSGNIRSQVAMTEGITEEPTLAPRQKVGVAKTFAGFLRTLNAKSHGDKVLSIAYFLLKTKNKNVVTKEDFENEYKLAFLPRSKNTSAEINWLIQRGYLMHNDEKLEGKRAFCITMDGISYVEEELMKKNEKE